MLRTLTKCDSTCKTCTEAASCATCHTGYEKGADTRAAPFCAPTGCAVGRYPDKDTGLCLKCFDTNEATGVYKCKECTGPNEADCTTSMDGWYIDAGPPKTIKECPWGC